MNKNVPKYGRKFFKVPLQNLEIITVTLTDGQQLIIPKRIHEICTYVLSKVQTEGLFRREGSRSRQQEIKLSLDRGCPLGDEYNVIDVAAVLKSFLRELPEPLIPQVYNDLFLMCSLEKRPKKDVLECLLLACLLLPSENLNVLSYLMQFFKEVASYSSYNKMTYSNLSILIGPNIFPMDDKLVPKSSFTITRICDITKLLIENSKNIGFIPDYIIDQMGQTPDQETEKRRKNKRRSGSLTRMLNGLKKIVSSRTEEEPTTPDLLITPTIHASLKKKKGEGGLSLKKKKEVLTKLPDCAILNTQFRTPVSVHPNDKKQSEEETSSSSLENLKEKKLHWYMRTRSMKSLKEEEAATSGNPRRASLGPKSLLERRWSAVSNAANFRKKKRTSCAGTKKELAMVSRKLEQKEEPEYVRVSKTEYEEFKNRVSAIERRISLELDNVQAKIDNENDNNVNREIAQEKTVIENVQSAYEKTLENANVSPTTDQLAKRLSRDLRIRRSADQKVIRSPSARKIGTLRRRSTEREKKTNQIVRNQSWHSENASAPLLPRLSTRRKRQRGQDSVTLVTPPQTTHNGVQRSASFPKAQTQLLGSAKLSDLSNNMDYSTCHSSISGDSHWVSAENFFSTLSATPLSDAQNSRASIAKLRAQNMGMVRAKAKLFDTLKDSDTSVSSCGGSANKPRPKKTVSTCRDASRTHRVSALRSEERKSKKNGLAETKTSKSHGKTVREVSKRHGQMKTPKRLCRTPALDKRTPFKVIPTPV
ncbi:LOW QUALITY PROTEIN: rho GTPase-activating protein 11A-like [Anthonomus grandis grandis]|uniref:LOW QUALITY PROTEIN: rho GTPase-activating protein 11A-like n=1 Tax=Anthonomus grandis grandis TaxID=2921223 RepID=UPI0021663850|nr:LOW QUALITY PROTEIN: rho GTPase-activating protein 11A-like [Anthonomus grandis grandis]